jgi:DNA-binding response OmpR family regulator
MARILVVEPHPEVRELLERVVGRLGHEVIAETDHDPVGVDLVLVEPQGWGATELARRAREESGAAVLCISVAPPTEESRALEPVAHMVKPFALAELDRAVMDALAGRKPIAA